MPPTNRAPGGKHPSRSSRRRPLIVTRGTRHYCGWMGRAEDLQFMARAVELAERAAALGEVPVGALVVDPEAGIIGEGFNQRETQADPTGHAEVVALRRAAQHRRCWRLEETTLYVTLEPCPMCAGALVNARVRRLVYGCGDPKAGAVRSLFALCEDPRLNHRLEVTSGVLADPCAKLLQDIFRKRRPNNGSALRSE